MSSSVNPNEHYQNHLTINNVRIHVRLLINSDNVS